MHGRVKRAQILTAYATATDPVERRRLLNQWLAAGGREVMNEAVKAGTASLRTNQDNEHGRES